MAVLSGTRHDPLRGFKYRVVITLPTQLGGTLEAGFQRISGLREESEVVEYRNGDELGGVRKLPGLVSYDNVTMERGQLLRGAADNDTLLQWRQLIQAMAQDGVVDSDEEDIRGAMTIYVYRRGGVPGSSTPDAEYHRQAIWPSVYEHSDLSGTDSEVWLERVEFAVEAGEMSVP
jgi:phage tail-like protein